MYIWDILSTFSLYIAVIAVLYIKWEKNKRHSYTEIPSSPESQHEIPLPFLTPSPSLSSQRRHPTPSCVIIEEENEPIAKEPAVPPKKIKI